MNTNQDIIEEILLRNCANAADAKTNALCRNVQSGTAKHKICDSNCN